MILLSRLSLFGSPLGCRNALVNVEAHPIDANVLTRRCVIAKMKEVTLDKYRDMMLQNAGALLVLLPENLAELDKEDKEVRDLTGLILCYFMYCRQLGSPFCA